MAETKGEVGNRAAELNTIHWEFGHGPCRGLRARAQTPQAPVEPAASERCFVRAQRHNARRVPLPPVGTRRVVAVQRWSCRDVHGGSRAIRWRSVRSPSAPPATRCSWGCPPAPVRPARTSSTARTGSILASNLVSDDYPFVEVAVTGSRVVSLASNPFSEPRGPSQLQVLRRTKPEVGRLRGRHPDADRSRSGHEGWPVEGVCLRRRRQHLLDDPVQQRDPDRARPPLKHGRPAPRAATPCSSTTSKVRVGPIGMSSALFIRWPEALTRVGPRRCVVPGSGHGCRRSNRMMTRGNPPETESVSVALVKPTPSNRLRVPT
jgi:hypothetical protein